MDMISVALVDDHRAIRDGIKNWMSLEEDMVVVGEASDAASGMALVRRLRPMVVVLDINLPDVSGIQVLKQIRVERLPVIAIMLTAYTDGEQIVQAMQNGAHGYCEKDADPDELIGMVRACARGQYAVGKNIFQTAERLEAWLTEQYPQSRAYLPSEKTLSDRELEILQCMAAGLSNKEIADLLSISIQTVKNHISSILSKMEMDDRTQAVVEAIRLGWVKPIKPKTTGNLPTTLDSAARPPNSPPPLKGLLSRLRRDDP